MTPTPLLPDNYDLLWGILVAVGFVAVALIPIVLTLILRKLSQIFKKMH